jgi:hypothetical protein
MDLLGGRIVPDQTFWVICALFYLADNIRLLSGRELIVAESLGRRWLPVFPLYRYRIAGRALSVLNLLMPALGAVRMAWLTPAPFARPELRRSARVLRLTCRRLLAFRALSALLFVTFFVVGPVLTHEAGLAGALVVVLPVHVAAVLLLVGSLIAARRAWGMSWSQLGSLAFECAVCPGFFVNVCRKVSLGFARVPGDALGLTLAFGGERATRRVREHLPQALDDLSENEELRGEDDAAIAAYRRHLGDDDADR